MIKIVQFIEFAGAVGCVVMVGKLAGLPGLLLCGLAWFLGGMFVIVTPPEKRHPYSTRAQVEQQRMQEIDAAAKRHEAMIDNARLEENYREHYLRGDDRLSS